MLAIHNCGMDAPIFDQSTEIMLNTATQVYIVYLYGFIHSGGVITLFDNYMV